MYMTPYNPADQFPQTIKKKKKRSIEHFKWLPIANSVEAVFSKSNYFMA